MTSSINEKKKVIPIIDCPICGAKDVPLSLEATMSKKGRPDIEVWACSNCGKVPNLAKDVKVKRWISANELKEMGWSKE